MLPLDGLSLPPRATFSHQNFSDPYTQGAERASEMQSGTAEAHPGRDTALCTRLETVTVQTWGTPAPANGPGSVPRTPQMCPWGERLRLGALAHSTARCSSLHPGNVLSAPEPQHWAPQELAGHLGRLKHLSCVFSGFRKK